MDYTVPQDVDPSAIDQLVALFATIGLVPAFFAAIVHIGFALAIYKHARSIETQFCGPGMWALATLALGPFMAVGYWIVHVSSLSASREAST